jgi:hypothetical protein
MEWAADSLHADILTGNAFRAATKACLLVRHFDSLSIVLRPISVTMNYSRPAKTAGNAIFPGRPRWPPAGSQCRLIVKQQRWISTRLVT